MSSPAKKSAERPQQLCTRTAGHIAFLLAFCCDLFAYDQFEIPIIYFPQQRLYCEYTSISTTMKFLSFVEVQSFKADVIMRH